MCVCFFFFILEVARLRAALLQGCVEIITLVILYLCLLLLQPWRLAAGVFVLVQFWFCFARQLLEELGDAASRTQEGLSLGGVGSASGLNFDRVSEFDLDSGFA